jgi:hypothetical protein
MARKKQVPLQRKPSNLDDGSVESPNRGWKEANGSLEGAAAVLGNGKPKQSTLPYSSEPAGFAQLMVCIAGIYASL